MSDHSLYIDTFVYTGIVNEIKNKASSCQLAEKPLESIKTWGGTDVGKIMKEVLDSVYATEELYKKQSSYSLPAALFKLRDSVVNTDKALSKSIKVEQDSNGE
ncbi:hypothetical protein D6853_00270 [Butyrivibrio sp. X503]|uniref:hypothetical protein n=1 Tax=Butyrivibrio sp. X503 TaxID=2364878 RepID=UPI000EA92398|nr:hypothetical protein [Butyrivibrio sp. X503]RKM58012.1 hypothetical protein D6853_00270 [Butyrivibrio sp. X503]